MLEGRGYLVLTYANAEALSDPDALAERISEVVRSRLRARGVLVED